MNLLFRIEGEKDERIVEQLTRDAFWDVYKPGCDEHYLLHQLRKSTSFIPELSLTAVLDDCIAGHALMTRAYVRNKGGQEHEVLCLGPISVLPSYQHQGIGSELMRYALQQARSLGYRAIVLFGNPLFYGKFGFVNAKAFHITTEDGQNFDAFMALELFEGSLSGICGKCIFDDCFKIDEAEAERFDARFPKREKHITDTQFKTHD